MGKLEKVTAKILNESDVSYQEAESVLLKLGFEMDVRGSHHVFRRKGYFRNVSIKRRPQLLPYQIKDLKEVLQDHGY